MNCKIAELKTHVQFDKIFDIETISCLFIVTVVVRRIYIVFYKMRVRINSGSYIIYHCEKL